MALPTSDECPSFTPLVLSSSQAPGCCSTAALRPRSSSSSSLSHLSFIDSAAASKSAATRSHSTPRPIPGNDPRFTLVQAQAELSCRASSSYSNPSPLRVRARTSSPTDFISTPGIKTVAVPLHTHRSSESTSNKHSLSSPGEGLVALSARAHPTVSTPLTVDTLSTGSESNPKTFTSTQTHNPYPPFESSFSKFLDSASDPNSVHSAADLPVSFATNRKRKRPPRLRSLINEVNAILASAGLSESLGSR